MPWPTTGFGASPLLLPRCYRSAILNVVDELRYNHAVSIENLYSGFVRLHILHHASAGPVFGLWLIQELGRHGYRLSPGTLYPILHSLERGGYLASERQLVGGRFRRVYSITPAGRDALEAAKKKVRELFSELFEELNG